MSVRDCLCVVAVLLAGSAGAQAEDYSAGKTPAQLFAKDCTACHRSAHGLAQGMGGRELSGFLAEHYTTSPDNAAALARYLASAAGGSSERSRRPEAEGRESPAAHSSRGRPATPRPGANVGEPDAEAAPATEPAQSTGEDAPRPPRRIHAARTRDAGGDAGPARKPRSAEESTEAKPAETEVRRKHVAHPHAAAPARDARPSDVKPSDARSSGTEAQVPRPPRAVARTRVETPSVPEDAKPGLAPDEAGPDAHPKARRPRAAEREPGKPAHPVSRTSRKESASPGGNGARAVDEEAKLRGYATSAEQAKAPPAVEPANAPVSAAASESAPAAPRPAAASIEPAPGTTTPAADSGAATASDPGSGAAAPAPANETTAAPSAAVNTAPTGSPQGPATAAEPAATPEREDKPSPAN